MGLSVIGSVFNITAIAINRYCYICHSFTYGRLYSFRNTLLLVALIWTLTVLAILPNFFVGSLSYDPRVYSCTFTQTASSSYTVVVVVVHFLVPIAVVTFCYLRIWVLVIQVRRKVKSEERSRVRPSDLRNFVTMFVVFVLFAICWAPLNLIGLMVAIDPEAWLHVFQSGSLWSATLWPISTVASTPSFTDFSIGTSERSICGSWRQCGFLGGLWLRPPGLPQMG